MPTKKSFGLNGFLKYGLPTILAIISLAIVGIITGIANGIGHSLYSGFGDVWHWFTHLPALLQVAIVLVIVVVLFVAIQVAGKIIARRNAARTRDARVVITRGIDESRFATTMSTILQGIGETLRRPPAPNFPGGEEMSIIKVVVATIESEFGGQVPSLTSGLVVDVEAVDPSSVLFSAPQDDVQLLLPLHLIGRAKESAWLQERLAANDDTRFIAVSGLTGLGKTALVAHTIRRMGTRNNRFGDGIAVVHCSNMKNASEVVRMALARFDPNRRPSASTEISSLTDLARRVLLGKDALIMLDNIEPLTIDTKEIVECFSGLGPHLAVVFTSVAQLPPGILNVEDQNVLPRLTEEEGLELFARSYGLGSADEFQSPQERAGARAIVEALGSHTLAVKITAAHARSTNRALVDLAEELDSSLHTPVPWRISGPVEATIEASIETLNSDSRRLLVAFLAFRTLEAGRKALTTLARGIGILAPEHCIDELVMRSLLEALPELNMPVSADRERLRMHPLVKVTAEKPFNIWQHEHSEEVTNAHRTIARHYARYVNSVPDTAFTPDLKNIDFALEWAIAHREDNLVIEICYGMRLYWHQRWLTVDSLTYLKPACKFAESRALRTRDYEDRRQAAALSLTYGRVLRRVGNLREAEARFKQDLRLRRRMGDRIGEADVLHQLGQLERCRGRMSRARRLCERALEIAQKREQQDTDSRRVTGLALAQLGRIERAEGHLEAAEERFMAAIARFYSTDDQLEIGTTFGYLARTARTRGNIALAEHYLDLSEQIAHRMQDQRAIGVAWSQRGRIARARGHMREAEQWFQQSVTIGEKIQDRQGLGVNYGYLGRIWRARGHLDVAQCWFKKSQKIAREVEDRQTQAIALTYMGRIARLKREGSARAYLKRSVSLLRLMGAGRSLGILCMQRGESALIQGQPAKARKYFEQGLRAMKAMGEMRGQGILLSGLARAAILDKNYTEARQHCDESFEIMLSLQDRRNVALILKLRAQIARETGDNRSATDLLEKSLRIFRKLDTDNPVIDVPETLIELGRVYLSMDNRQLARQCAEEAREIYEKMGILVKIEEARKLQMRAEAA